MKKDLCVTIDRQTAIALYESLIGVLQACLDNDSSSGMYFDDECLPKSITDMINVLLSIRKGVQSEISECVCELVGSSLNDRVGRYVSSIMTVRQRMLLDHFYVGGEDYEQLLKRYNMMSKAEIIIEMSKAELAILKNYDSVSRNIFKVNGSISDMSDASVMLCDDIEIEKESIFKKIKNFLKRK